MYSAVVVVAVLVGTKSACAFVLEGKRGGEKMATLAPAQVPAAVHLECLEKIWKIPMMEMAWNQSAGMYDKVKQSHSMFNWTLSTAEATMLKALEQAAPIAKRFEQPIHVVDQTLCKGLEMVEEKLPFVKEPPQHIYDTAKNYVNAAVASPMDTMASLKDYGTEKAKSMKKLSLDKANELLATRYGNMALSGFETTAQMAEHYLDYYFPATANEAEQERTESSEEGNKDHKVMHTINTVGRLSNKFARRVYRILSNQVQNLNKDNMQQYISSMATIMHLTNYLHSVNESLKQKADDQKKESSTEERPKSQ